MRINGFRCDACCKEHLLDPTLIMERIPMEIPNGWYMVVRGLYRTGLATDEPLLFCSKQCLYDWAAKAVIPIEVDPTLPDDSIRMDNVTLRGIEREKPWLR
jgi:hypothetical protein